MRGQAAYQQGDYAAAAQLWEQAYAAEARPALQYNLAQAYGRLGRLEDEQAALRRFVDGANADDPLLVSARARLATIEQRLAHTGVVLHSQGFDGAVILIDGEDRGRLPHPDAFPLRPGSHTVDISLDGYQPFHAAVVVPPGESVDVTVVMQRSMEQPVARERNPMLLPIALYAAGGALVATGVVFGGLALSESSGAVDGSHAADKAHTFAIVSDVTLFTGIATAATGLVFHLLRRKHHDDAPATSAANATSSFTVSPAAGPSGFGLQAFGRF